MSIKSKNTTEEIAESPPVACVSAALPRRKKSILFFSFGEGGCNTDYPPRSYLTFSAHAIEEE